MNLGLSGKSCIVTGASRGIGRCTAELLRAEGANVLMVARGEQALCDSAAELGAEHLVCDVTATDAGERMLEAATAAFGQVDVLVNNAGAATLRGFDDVSDEHWQAAWDLNVMAPMRAMRAVAPAMQERSWGRIVNVSSTAGKRPSASMPEYSVAKAAELSLSRLYADRYAAAGVLINAITPAATRSEMWTEEGGLADQTAARAGLDGRDAAFEKAGAGRPIGRVAEVGEIAAAIVFLCSERASYVSGAAWSVDGGTVPVII